MPIAFAAPISTEVERETAAVRKPGERVRVGLYLEFLMGECVAQRELDHVGHGVAAGEHVLREGGALAVDLEYAVQVVVHRDRNERGVG